ncbi:FIG4-like protein [Mya arenaria]|uniref:FIG4-like protein n=1 Tax=Mya arenaria TaxID=6604 RepID=A0ABY7EEU1_MYAAR|nr:FIG4-like protein [Mya arenaria]
MEFPIISAIQRLQVYETKARYYIIGSNATETAFRVLKVDRQEPKELVIHDDKHVYNKVDVRKLLEMIASGNTKVTSKQKQIDNSLLKCVAAYGIVGFVRFLEGYYMVLITKRSAAAVIGGHVIYKIEDTVMLYVKMFQSVDLSSDFYFSYSYDLTHTLQYNMAQAVDPKFGPPTQADKDEQNVYGVKVKPETLYVWNHFLTQPFKADPNSDWVLPIIHGFIAQAIANEVETEQIVQDMSVTQLHHGRVSSYVQMRGSIPLYWSQDISKMVPKPAITIDKRDPYFHTAGLHFNRCLYRYGSPVILLNLVKRREKRRHESLLADEYKDCKTYLNQFLPPDRQMIYIGFDMAHYTKKQSNDVFDRLAGISRFCVKQTGFFLHLPQMREGFWSQEEYEGVKGFKTSTGCKQTGAVRTNCVDCIDRTNTAQFAVGKCALAYQLCALGVLPVPDLDFDTDCVTMLEELYEDQGNTIALQYGGSNLVHRIEGYRKIAPWKAHSVDIFNTLSRYYSNAFSDMEKQQAMNVFLGVFLPRENEPCIWDLPTDFYLHNPDVQGSTLNRKRYTMWCDQPIFDHLPLPYDEACKTRNCLVQVMSKDDEAVNMFFENYKPYRLTELKAFNKDMEKCISQELSRTISVKDSTASTSSSTSEDATSSSASSIEGDIVTTSSDDEGNEYFQRRPRELNEDTEENLYDLDLSRFEEDEFTQELYKRYVDIGAADQSKLDPLGEYTSDIYSVEEPTVSHTSLDVYFRYVECGMAGASDPAPANRDIYRNYIKQLYM